MTVGLTDLLDLAISPQIGPVNFFHLRNLLHTMVEHFGIGDVEAQQAETKLPQSLGVSSSAASSDEDTSDEGRVLTCTFTLVVYKMTYTVTILERSTCL